MHAPALDLTIRRAGRHDLVQIVALFAADSAGGHGDTCHANAFTDYLTAFEQIIATATEALYVAELNGEVVGTFQTTALRSLVGRGSSSLMIEAVQTRSDMRGRGIGEAMMRFAIHKAQAAGFAKVMLTSNAERKDAHRFYERVGFLASHLGFKIRLK